MEKRAGGLNSRTYKQRGRKQILDGGTQVNTRKLFLQNYHSFSNFYSIKHPKDGGT